MLSRMSSAELTDQMAYDIILQAEQEKADRLARKGMRPR